MGQMEACALKGSLKHSQQSSGTGAVSLRQSTEQLQVLLGPLMLSHRGGDFQVAGSGTNLGQGNLLMVYYPTVWSYLCFGMWWTSCLK